MTVALTGGAALVGEDLTVVPEATILLDDERIVAVGPREEIGIPSGARVIPLDGTTLMPGFIDAHVHIGFADPAEVLARGVTTVRDLGWPARDIHPLAEDSRTPGFDGPQILAAGPILTATGGYPARAAWAPDGTAREVSGAREAERAVAATADEGACIVKIALNPPVGPTLDASEVSAIVRAAEGRGLRVTGHIYGLSELEKAISSGVHELAHMLMSDEEIPDDMLRRMVDADVVVVPTLAVRFGAGRDLAIRNLARFRAKGGSVVYGTDLGNEGPLPGIDPREVEAMGEAGFSAIDIARTATIDAARHLQLDDRGCLAPGKLADIVAVEGRVEEARDLHRPVRVWRRGREAASARNS